MGVLIFGSLNIDIVTYLKRMPLPGETVLGDRFETFPGGKGLNQAVAAARAKPNRRARRAREQKQKQIEQQKKQLKQKETS